jgi:hypothetical protein
MSKLNLTNLDARALIALAQAAKSPSDIDPVIAEFARRVERREAKLSTLAGKAGAQASASILGHGKSNLAAVRAMRDALTPAPAMATFVAAPIAKPKRARKSVAKPAGVTGIVAQIASLTAEDRAALRALLA